jgi:hypothetical protein
MARGGIQQTYQRNRSANIAKALQSVELALEQAVAPGDMKLDTPIIPLIAPDFSVPPSEWQRNPGLDNALGDLNHAFTALSQIPGDLQGKRTVLAESMTIATKSILTEIYAIKAQRETSFGVSNSVPATVQNGDRR